MRIPWQWLQSVVDASAGRLEAFGQPRNHRVIGFRFAGRICQAKDANGVDAIHRVSLKQELGVENIALLATGDYGPVLCGAAIGDGGASVGKVANEGSHVVLEDIVATPDHQFCARLAGELATVAIIGLGLSSQKIGRVADGITEAHIFVDIPLMIRCHSWHA